MEVSLISPSPRARSPTRGGLPAGAADPHTVQLSRYDGRLLMDRSVVPEDHGFADTDDAEAGRIDTQWPQRFNHYAAALGFFAATAGYAGVLAVLGARCDWGAHREKWGAVVAGQSGILALGFLLELGLKHVHRKHRADGHLQVYRFA